MNSDIDFHLAENLPNSFLHSKQLESTFGIRIPSSTSEDDRLCGDCASHLLKSQQVKEPLETIETNLPKPETDIPKPETKLEGNTLKEKIVCINCNKSLGRLSVKWDLKALGELGISPPSNMGEEDRLCHTCGEYIKNSQKGDTVESKKLMEIERANLNVKATTYKTKWNKDGIIQFKNERIAILKRGFGKQVEFIVAFDELTQNGYRLMAHDEGKEVAAGGFSGGVNSYFYFQKIDFVSVGHQKLERGIPEKVDPTTTRNAL